MRKKIYIEKYTRKCNEIHYKGKKRETKIHRKFIEMITFYIFKYIIYIYLCVCINPLVLNSLWQNNVALEMDQKGLQTFTGEPKNNNLL